MTSMAEQLVGAAAAEIERVDAGIEFAWMAAQMRREPTRYTVQSVMQRLEQATWSTSFARGRKAFRACERALLALSE